MTNSILYNIYKIYRLCEIKSFPFNCFDLLNKLSIKSTNYNDLDAQKKSACFLISTDAFKFKNTIFYNDNMPLCRIRFSLMHELGHVILNHKKDYRYAEYEANAFAGNILAPKIAIHEAKCKSYNDIALKFNLSFKASEIAYNQYKHWLNIYEYYNRLTHMDQCFYNHFYSQHFNGFVYNIYECDLCNEKIYNHLPHKCKDKSIPRTHRLQPVTPSIDFLHAEHIFLYGR